LAQQRLQTLRLRVPYGPEEAAGPASSITYTKKLPELSSAEQLRLSNRVWHREITTCFPNRDPSWFAFEQNGVTTRCDNRNFVVWTNGADTVHAEIFVAVNCLLPQVVRLCVSRVSWRVILPLLLSDRLRTRHSRFNAWIAFALISIPDIRILVCRRCCQRIDLPATRCIGQRPGVGEDLFDNTGASDLSEL